MRNGGRVAVFVLLILWLLNLAPPAMAMDRDDAPESITLDYLAKLYEAVEFDHLMHTDLFSCGSCHHHATGTDDIRSSCARCHEGDAPADDIACSGCHDIRQSEAARNSDIKNGRYHIDKPSLKGALHLQCLGCHQTEEGPTGCLDCHNFTEAGKKRFAIKE